jgi:hypothetical protein
MKEPLSGLGVCAMRKLHTTNPWSFAWQNSELSGYAGQRFTRRKKELVDFDAAESGMTAYFCARYENQKGERGSWGTVVSAIIP